MEKKYRVQLTAEEQEELRDLVSKGRTAAYRQTHAHILLLSYENQVVKDVEIARALKVGPPQWNGCDGGVWRKVWREPWGARSKSTAA